MNINAIDNLYSYLEKGSDIDTSHVSVQGLFVFHALCCELLSVVIAAITQHQSDLSEELETDDTNRRMTNCTRILDMLGVLKIVVSNDTTVLQQNIGNTSIAWKRVLALTALHGAPIYVSDAYRMGDRATIVEMVIQKNTSDLPLTEIWCMLQQECNAAQLDKVWKHTLDVITCACKLVPL